MIKSYVTADDEFDVSIHIFYDFFRTLVASLKVMELLLLLQNNEWTGQKIIYVHTKCEFE